METKRHERIARLLMLEDSPEDSILIQNTLKKAGLNFETTVVSSRKGFIEALNAFLPDIVLSDHTLPQFSSPEALQICREKYPNVPFILVTGTVSEEFAASIIKAGADDYVLKNNLKRLSAAIVQTITKKGAEADLKVTHERLLFHIENSPLGFIEWDNQLLIKTCSKRAEQIFGWSESELIALHKDAFSQVYEGDLPWVSEILKQLMAGLVERNTVQHRNYTKDGRVIWCEWFNSVQKENGKVIGIMSLVQDITEKKNAEKLIKDERILLRTLVDNLPFNVYTKNIHSRKTLANRAEYEFLGAKTEEEVLGKDDSEFFPQEFAERTMKEEQQVFATGQAIINEEGSHTINGHDIWFLKSKIPLKNEDNEIVGLVGISYDITSRKEIEQQIRNSEEKRRLIMNAAIDAIICIDLNGAITFWNPQAEKVFGWKAAEVSGRLLSETIVPEAYREKHNKGIENYLKTGSGPILNILFEMPAINREKKQFPIELTILPIKQGKEEFFCAFIRDITERTNAIQAIKTQNEKLREIAWTQSHSVRAPLARIMGLANLLSNHPPGKNVADEFISHLVDSANELDEIIKAIVSKTELVETGESLPKPEPTTHL